MKTLRKVKTFFDCFFCEGYGLFVWGDSGKVDLCHHCKGVGEFIVLVDEEV